MYLIMAILTTKFMVQIDFINSVLVTKIKTAVRRHSISTLIHPKVGTAINTTRYLIVDNQVFIGVKIALRFITTIEIFLV